MGSLAILPLPLIWRSLMVGAASGPQLGPLPSTGHGGPGDEPPGVGAVASVTQAVAATGKMPGAVAWATDMAEYGSSLTGTQISLLVNAYGDFGGMAFISVTPDMAATDATAAIVRADAGYIERINASAGLFVDGSAHQGLLRRIA